MAQIIIPGKWMQQPQGPVEIDWNNPFCQNLVQLYIPSISNLNLVTKRSLNQQYHNKGYVKGLIGAKLVGGFTTNAFPSDFTVNSTNQLITLIGSTDRHTDGYAPSLVAWSGTEYYPVLYLHNAYYNTPGFGHGSFIYGMGKYIPPGQIAALSMRYTNVGGYDYKTGYLNGLKISTPQVWGGATHFKLHHNIPNNTETVILYALHHKGPSDEVIASVHENPWQIFKPIKRQFWVGPSANIFTRYARPLLDISNSGWSASSGSDLYAMIDEETPSDTDYIFATTSGATYEGKLQPVEDPATSTNQVIKYRTRSIYGNTLIAKLKQGSTVIATRTHTNVPSEWTTYSMILSESEANAITDYTDLRIVTEIA